MHIASDDVSPIQSTNATILSKRGPHSLSSSSPSSLSAKRDAQRYQSVPSIDAVDDQTLESAFESAKAS